MLDVKEDTANIYVFAGVIPAFIPVTLAVTGNNITVKKAPEGIVSETAHITLVLAAAQARSSFIDPMTVWKKLTTFKGKKKSFITTDGGLTSSKANRDDRSGSRHIIGGEKDNKNVRGEGEK